MRRPVSRRLLERHRDTTYSHRLAALGVAHEHGLFIDWATAGGALADGTTEEFALHLAVLTDDERGAPTGYAKHEAQGAKVAIFDPELLLLDVLEHLSDQATLLGMAILTEKHIGNQHALLVQHH